MSCILIPISPVYPSNRQLSVKIKALAEFLNMLLLKSAYWYDEVSRDRVTPIYRHILHQRLAHPLLEPECECRARHAGDLPKLLQGPICSEARPR